MANALYSKARQRFLEGQLNWLTDTIKVVLVDTGAYTFSEAHEFLSSVPAPSRITGSTLLTGKTTTDGAANADNSPFLAVTGTTIEALVIYKEVLDGSSNPDDTLSVLIAYIDTATGLPITPNGGTLLITWDNGPNKIFRL